MGWEYTTFGAEATGWLRPDVDDAEVHRRLNSLGATGWELVSVVPLVVNGYTSRCVFVLKHPTPPREPEAAWEAVG